MALAWSVCHGLCPLFLPLDRVAAVRKSWVFNAAKSTLTRSIVVQTFRYVLLARRTLNSRRSLSRYDQLHVDYLVNSATWFFTEDHFTVRQIVTNWFWCMIQFLTSRTFCWFLSSSLHLIRWHLETLSSRRSISKSGFLSTAGSEPRTSFLVLVRVSVELPLYISCPRLARRKFPCTCQRIITKGLLLLRMRIAFQCHFWCWSRGWESSEQYSISVLRDYSVDAVCWHKTVNDDCMWLRLPDLQSWSCARENFTQ